jgi:hypothetical protein
MTTLQSRGNQPGVFLATRAVKLPQKRVHLKGAESAKRGYMYGLLMVSSDQKSQFDALL